MLRPGDLLVRRERSMFRNAEKPVRELVDKAGPPAPRQPDREGVLLGLWPAGFHELAFADWGPLEDKRRNISSSSSFPTWTTRRFKRVIADCRWISMRSILRKTSVVQAVSPQF